MCIANVITGFYKRGNRRCCCCSTRFAMIDFHAHILPGMDDGSSSLAMTEAMLREEKRQGVECVVATPHFYANQMAINVFLEKRAAAMVGVERICRESGGEIPEVVTGAEVFYFSGMGDAREISRLCVEGTKTILVEMPFREWSAELLRDIEALTGRRGLHVVLAHVERYIGIQRNTHVWNQLLSLPLTPQINAGSFLKPDGLFRSNRNRRFCMDFLKAHPHLIVASDCHNMENRAPNLGLARAEIAAALGAEALKGIDAAGREALFRAEQKGE